MDKLPPKSAKAIERELTVHRPGRTKAGNLRDQVTQNWPTPTKSDYKGAVKTRLPGTEQYRGNLAEAAELADYKEPPQGTIPRLSPDWAEWLMGWPIGWTDRGNENPKVVDWSQDPHPEIPRVKHNVDNRAKRIIAIGNGQCPQAMALAFVLLYEILVTQGKDGKNV